LFKRTSLLIQRLLTSALKYQFLHPIVEAALQRAARAAGGSAVVAGVIESAAVSTQVASA
jgi:hypothetical protein